MQEGMLRSRVQSLLRLNAPAGQERLTACSGCPLQLSNHTAALLVLALDMGDIRGAERYCNEHAGPQGRLALLRMLLAPGQGRPPLYAEACHLLAVAGAPQQPARATVQ